MRSQLQAKRSQSRVNITLDIGEGNQRRKVELPLKLLVLGNLSGDRVKTTPLKKREKLKLERNGVHQLMRELQVQLTIPADHLGGKSESVQFEHPNDFSADALVQKLPPLKKLMAMRNLLRDLRANVIDNKAFLKALSALVEDPAQRAALKRAIIQGDAQ